MFGRVLKEITEDFAKKYEEVTYLKEYFGELIKEIAIYVAGTQTNREQTTQRFFLF